MLRLKKNESGVVSLEACIVVPMFVLLLLFFYGFIILTTGEQIVNHSLIQCAESLSLDPFATDKFNLDEIDNGGKLVQALYAGQLKKKNQNFASTSKWYSGNKDLLCDTVKKRFIGFTAGSEDQAAAEMYADSLLREVGVKDGLKGINFTTTKIDNGTLTITVKYKQEFIFNFQGLAAIDREKSVSVKLWN